MWTTSFTGGLPHAFFTMHPAQAAKQKKPGNIPGSVLQPCFMRYNLPRFVLASFGNQAHGRTTQRHLLRLPQAIPPTADY